MPRSISAAPPHRSLIPHERLGSDIERLRLEVAGAPPGRARAVLLHEIATLQIFAGDYSASVAANREALAEEPAFGEPLRELHYLAEHALISPSKEVIEQRWKIASSAEERFAALMDRSVHSWLFETSPHALGRWLDIATKEPEADNSPWLLLDWLSCRLEDADERESALIRRITATEHPTWKALLTIELARVRADQGNYEGALETLDPVLVENTGARFHALLALEQLGKNSRRSIIEGQALKYQAELIFETLNDSARADALGIPRYRRSPEHAVDAWLSASELYRQFGDTGTAAAILDAARVAIPSHPLLLYARQSLAESSGDLPKIAELAQVMLAQDATGSLAAARFLRVAEARAAEADPKEALLAIQKATEQDPSSVPARALELELLLTLGDSARFAATLESIIEQLPSDEAKARICLESASIWARLCGDAPAARGALSQAAMFGAEAPAVARMARLLAALMGDPGWYEDSIKRLITLAKDDPNTQNLWFELARTRALRGDRNGASRAFVGLIGLEVARWLGEAGAAYVTGLITESASSANTKLSELDGSSGAQALLRLAAHETDLPTIRALRSVAALRSPKTASADFLAALQALHEEDPADLVIAAELDAIFRAENQYDGAARILVNAAEHVKNDETRAILRLEAGILSFRAHNYAAAIQLWESAGDAQVTHELLAWAEQAVSKEHAQKPRALLHFKNVDAELASLFRLGFVTEDHPQNVVVQEAITNLQNSDLPDLALAGSLVASIWPSAYVSVNDRLDCLGILAHAGPGAAKIAKAATFQEARQNGDPARVLEQKAADFAETDGSLVSALEWLSAARGTDEPEREALARKALGARLPERAKVALDASAALLLLFAGQGSAAPIESDLVEARLTNLELAPPGCDPRRRAQALNQTGNALGEESQTVLASLIGFNHLVSGNYTAAIEAFRRAVAAFPTDLYAWDGLRTAAEAAGDRKALAEACAALGDGASSAEQGAELWEQAALIWLDELHDEKAGEHALNRAVARDIGRGVAFDRLFRRVRERRDNAQLLDLIEGRLLVTEDPEELVKLYWEQARALRNQGDREGALAALENVRLLEADHVGALALSGEIYINQQQFAEAAESLALLSKLAHAPPKQRLMSALAAADLFEGKLSQVQSALDVLSDIDRAGLGTLAVRERLARIAAKAEAWSVATGILEQLMRERSEPNSRIEAARLALAIYRDRLAKPKAAEAAVSALLNEAPSDGEGLDFLLSNHLPDAVAKPFLQRGRASLIAELERNALDVNRWLRLSSIALYEDDLLLRQTALGALVTLEHGTPALQAELEDIDQRLVHVPQIALNDAALDYIADPEDKGAAGEVLRLSAETIAEAIGPSLQALNVSKRERVDARLGLPLRNEIAAWAGALGIQEFELYVGGRDPLGVTAVPGETPAIVVGANVSAPLSSYARQAVARELYGLRRGTTILRHREHAEVVALIVAACRVVEVDVPSPPFALLSEFQKLLSKYMSRKVRKVLPEIAARLKSSNVDLAKFCKQAAHSQDRMALLATGDLSWVLATTAEQRGRFVRSHEQEYRAQRLVNFALSSTYLELRRMLGLVLR